MASISPISYFKQMATHTIHEQVIYDIVLLCKRLSHADNARVHIRMVIDRKNLFWLSISCKKTFSNINYLKVLHMFHKFHIAKNLTESVFSGSEARQTVPVLDQYFSVSMTGNFLANIKQVSTVLSMACPN